MCKCTYIYIDICVSSYLDEYTFYTAAPAYTQEPPPGRLGGRGPRPRAAPARRRPGQSFQAWLGAPEEEHRAEAGTAYKDFDRKQISIS